MELKPYYSDWYIGCQDYPKCTATLKLPKGIISSVKVRNDQCQNNCAGDPCSLDIKIRKNAVPPGEC